jgi:hypothetical protein
MKADINLNNSFANIPAALFVFYNHKYSSLWKA